MQKDDRVYLHHILDAIGSIQRYIAGISYEDLVRNELVQDGVVRRLEIIGEASRNLSEEFRERHPDVPWHRIIGMRNRIVHAYFSLDLKAVWDAATLDVPELKARIEEILQSL